MTASAHRLWAGVVLLVTFAATMALETGRWSVAFFLLGLFLVLTSFGEAKRDQD